MTLDIFCAKCAVIVELITSIPNPIRNIVVQTPNITYMALCPIFNDAFPMRISDIGFDICIICIQEGCSMILSCHA